MPTGNLPSEGKALHKKVYDQALKGSCKGDKECAARVAWTAVKNAGWSKDKDGNWHKKSVLSEFSLYISKASFDKTTQRMNWFAVASDTDEDTFKDNMTESLFDDFVNRIVAKEEPPEKYRSKFWAGGNPYMSISHYPDLEGKAVPGVVESVYKDGSRLKARGYFSDTPLGRACFRSICRDLYPKEGETTDSEGKVRISIAFLDYSHRHKSSGYVFNRDEEPVCLECVKEMLAQSEDGLEFLKGHLIHLALTRVPANARTLIEPLEVDKMAINTRKDDALSIVGDDEEAKSLVEEIADEASMVGKSELVIKSESEDVEPEIVEEGKHMKEDEEEDDDEMSEDEKKKKKEMEKKSEVVEAPSVDLTPILSAIAELKSEIASLKSVPETHPLDGIFSTFRSHYDEIVRSNADANEKLQTLQAPFNVFGEAVVEQIRSLAQEDEPEVEQRSSVSVDEVRDAVIRQIGPQLEEIKSMLSKSAVPVVQTPEQALDQTAIRNAVMRRSLLPKEAPKQETLQNRKDGVKSIREISEMTTRI